MNNKNTMKFNRLEDKNIQCLADDEIREVSGGILPFISLGVGIASRYITHPLAKHFASRYFIGESTYSIAKEIYTPPK